MLKPFGQILTLRPEVLDPALLLDMVDLGLVSGGGPKRGLVGSTPGLDTVRDPSAFFGITYPTREIVETLRTLAARAAAPESVPGTILLSGRYGQGKSHVLLAAHHALTAPQAAAAWADRWSIGGLDLPPDPLVVTRAFMQHAEEPLWETLLAAVAPGRKPKFGDFPDGALLESLLGDRPVFVILDEIEGWFDGQDERTRSRNRNFLQALTEVSMRTGRLTVLTSILGISPEPGETIRRVRPLELSFRSAEDRQKVVLYRLFADRDAPAAVQAAEHTADAYLGAWQTAGVRGLDGMRARLVASWPFTPEFLDILLKKVPNLGGFQSTRGTLRFLSHVVGGTHARRPIVSSQDLPFQVDAVHQALTNIDTSGGEVVRRALGDNYEAVPEDLPHRDALFSTLVFYSIADPTHPGATLDEILLATLDPGENPLEIRDALTRLKQLAFNLHDRDERLVFLSFENPHARINAMAASQLVTREATRQHVLTALDQEWGGAQRTAVHQGDLDATRKRLRDIRQQRPRIVLSTSALSPKARLQVQNLDEDRNLVLLVEPKVHTASADRRYDILTDEALVRHARRIEACKLLLEGRPAQETADVYRSVLRTETERLRKEVRERYGIAIAWHRAGATGAEVDDTWYEVSRLDIPSAQGLLDLWRAELTGLPEVRDVIAAQWTKFRTRSVAELAAHFDRTPGLPVPLEASWVPLAVRQLVKEGTFSLVGADGAVVAPPRVAGMPDDQLSACTLTDPMGIDEPTTEEHEPVVHVRVSAQYDPARKAVHVSWGYPPAPDGGTLSTLVQRYTTARGWQDRRAYPIDTGATHEANRYQGTEEHCVDVGQLQPGSCFYYYVFLVHTRPDGETTYWLSRRCDVVIPPVTSTDPDVIETTIQPNLTKLLAELERLLMSGKMSSEARARKVVLKIGAVTDDAVKAHLAGQLQQRAGDGLEATADLTLTSRGAWSRQEVLALVRLSPRFDNATYQATVHLKSDPSRKGDV